MSDAAAEQQSVKVNDLFSVAGKVVVVTGGSRGIGLMIARGFVENGAKVYISSRKAEVCAETAAELSKQGECIAIPANLATAEGRKTLVEAVGEREASLPVLVNNAGVNWGAPFEEYPESGYDKVMDINVKGVFMLTRDFMPLLEKAVRPGDPARVINVGSIDATRVPFYDNFAYPPSKAAVHQMSRVLAVRLGRKGITVNVIAPGFFVSEMTDWLIDNFEERLVAECPLERIGAPSDMAAAALYLASPAGAFVNGAVITVDGGLSAG